MIPRQHGSDLERLLTFVKARIEDQAQGPDRQRALWATGFLHQIEEMEAFLGAVPPSVYEVERFLLRIAFLHRHHPDYLPYWDLRQPGALPIKSQA